MRQPSVSEQGGALTAMPPSTLLSNDATYIAGSDKFNPDGCNFAHYFAHSFANYINYTNAMCFCCCSHKQLV
jgi:hypothetical protein